MLWLVGWSVDFGLGARVWPPTACLLSQNERTTTMWKVASSVGVGVVASVLCALLSAVFSRFIWKGAESPF